MKGRRITLCGSTRFKQEFELLNLYLSLHGAVVYTVAFFGHADGWNLTDDMKATLDEVHQRKILNSDSILVVDVGGYIGKSTRKEIQLALDNGKDVVYLTKDPEFMQVVRHYKLQLKDPGIRPNVLELFPAEKEGGA